MSEVPRIKRLMDRTVNPKIAKCGNCEDKAIDIGGPFCRKCGLDFDPVDYEIDGDVITFAYKVRGKGLRVYFNESFRRDETPIPVDLTIRELVDLL